MRGGIPDMNELSLELTFLLWSVAITFIQLIVSLLGATVQHGLPTLAGNRENIGPTSGWAGRAQRAHRNMLENLILFAILVIVAHIAGISNELTILGAQLFFWGRLAYSLIYVIGIAWLRTAAFLISILGLILIFLQLV